MEPLSGAEGSRFDRLCSEHDAIHNDDRCAPAVLVERIEAPPAGSVFDVVDHTDSHDDWGIGARRGIAEAIRYFPDAKSREGLLVYRWLRRYRVTPEAIRIAKACGVFKTEQAMGKQLWKFEQKLRSNNILRWS